MKQILVGLVLAAAIAAIALGARGHFLKQGRGAPAGTEPGTGVAADSGADPAAAAELHGTVAPAAGAVAGPEDAGRHGGGAAEEGAAGRTGEAVAVEAAGRPAPGAGAAVAEERQAAGAGEADRPASSQDDGAAILKRAASAYEGIRSLKAEFTQRVENTVLGTTTTSRGTLYQRRPDRFLMRFDEPAGDVVLSDGRHFWVYYPSVDAKQVIRTPAAEGGAGAVDLQAQFVGGDPLERFSVTYEGREAVAGRDASVLTLVPKKAAGYRRLKVWVDARDHLVRRFEITEDTGNTRLFELRGLEVNPRLDDGLFQFTPPADARIIDRG